MSCENKELARRGPFQIHCCSECGGFSLHLGAITLRLDEQAVRSLTGMLKDGLARLERDWEESAPTTLNLLFPRRAGSEPSS